ncbi:T-cell-interacting, activating receptor on myeloid cells protein 1 [Pteronotus mesoamericanus]|uniref:T-cell-interacting, activating receptor on myeloid cells protein 1 n=1 Tax=Pteronotus mesoamericanus TaxID=1884717 RepID=UPI0023EC5EAA|nr:T-cell-interacting, activating receptor on myeloid cells protein 1-like [Pteronotus parnellii mesoamericanus]
MIYKLLPLLCFRLCVGYGDWIDVSLPRPSISAWPSWMVPVNSNVTLRCLTPIREVKILLRKLGHKEYLPSSDSPEGMAEFYFPDVKTRNAGKYTCEYYRRLSPNISSLSSDTLLLVVTGNLPKPSLQAHHGGNVTAGANVTLQCQKPGHVTEFSMFALLKKGSSMPTQLRSPVGRETDFSLQRVTVGDTGNYSCVYYHTRAPFWASEPSDQLALWVTGSPGATARDITVGDLVRLGLSAVILVLMGAFLVEAWWSQKGPPR